MGWRSHIKEEVILDDEACKLGHRTGDTLQKENKVDGGGPLD